MNNKKKKGKFFVILRIIRKRVKLRTILLLALTFAANSYAWFIYTTKVNNSVEAHVRSWNVRFDFEESEIAEFVNFNIDDMYPGMTEYSNFINIINSGEALGKISYEIVSARIMNDNYVVDGEVITSEGLINSLTNDYPFIIDIGVSNLEVTPNGGEEQFYIRVNWAYESGDDALDTYWGNQAYDYHLANPDTPVISLRIKISVVQA